MDEYHQYAGVAQTIGVDVKFLTPQQVKRNLASMSYR
jgi:dimethylglycine dehydrogenase